MKKEYIVTTNGTAIKMYAENDSEIINAVVNQMNMLLSSNTLKDWQHRPALETTATENGRQILHITY